MAVAPSAPADVDMAAVQADVANRRANPGPIDTSPAAFARNPGTASPEDAAFEADVAAVGGGKRGKFPKRAAPADTHGAGAGWFNMPLDQVQPYDAAPQGALAPRRKEALEGVSEKTKEALAKSDQPGKGWFNKGLDEITPVEAPPPPEPEAPKPSRWQRLGEAMAATNAPPGEEAESEVGAGEAGVSAITGLTAAPLGQGISTMASLAAGRGLNESVERGQKTAEALTYQPRTEQGKAAAQIAQVPFEKIEDFADAVGQHLMEQGYTDPETGLSGAVNPAIAAGVKTAIMQLAMAAPFKAAHIVSRLGGDPLAQIAHRVVEGPQTVMDHAQSAAAAAAKAAGGDDLDAVVAATHANAAVGAHHDAAAVHATRVEAAKKAAEDELANAEAAQEELQKDQDFGAAERQAGKAPGKVPSPDEAFAQREQEGALAGKRAAAQKEQDFGAAKNQVGDQQVAAAENIDEGRAKGGAEEPKPVLADALSLEQVSALAALRARLLAQKGEPAPEPSVAERLRAQAKGTEDDFLELPPETSRKLKVPSSEEELPESGPPAATARTLAERRQAAFDEALAKKVRGGAESSNDQTNMGRVQANAQHVAGDERPVPESQVERVPQVRGPGDQGSSGVAEELRSLPARRAATTEQAAQSGPNKQRRALRTGERPVGNEPGAAIEHPKERTLRVGGREALPASVGGQEGIELLNRPVAESAKPEQPGIHTESAGRSGEQPAGDAGRTPPPNRLAAIRAAAERRQQPAAARALPESKRAEPGTDPAEQLIEAKVKEDADRAHAAQAAAEAEAGPGVTKGALAAKRAQAQRTLPSAAQDIIDELRAGRGKPPTARFADVRQMNPWTKMNQDLKAARAEMERARDAGDYQAYQKAADKHDAIRERVMRIARQENAGQQPVPPGSKPTSKFAEAATVAEPEDVYQVAEDLDKQSRMSGDEAKDHLDTHLSQIDPRIAERTHIHNTIAEAVFDRKAPISDVNREALRQAVVAGKRYAGMFDPDTNHVHIFADGHYAGQREELIRTLAHEYTHFGLRNVLGKEYASTLEDVFANAKNRQWIDDFLSKNKLDGKNPENQRHAADEYAAYLSEHTDADPGTWQKIVDGVRNALRKVGLVRDWTDNDIRDLIRRNNPALDKLDTTARGEQGPTARFAPDKAADSPLAERLGGMTKEEQTKYTPKWNEKLADTMRDFGFKSIPHLLSVVDMRHLPDFVNDREMPSAKRFIQTNDSRRGRAGRLQQPAFDRLREWSRDASRDPKANADFGTIVHASTIAGVDPSKPYESRWSAEERAEDPAKAAADKQLRDVHATLKKMFDALPSDKWRQRYSDVRDDYTAHRDATWKGLEARINETNASDDTKKSALASLRRMFEAGKVAGPYFPLFRTGDYWARAMDADGNHVSFTRFESTGERRQWVKNMQDLGFDIEQGKKDTSNKSLMERIDPEFVRQIMDVTKDSPELQDEIWQTYLKALPEMSMRKQFIHRQGRLGFSADAMRAYAHNMFHGSQQIARLEYGNRMDTHVRDLKDQADALQKAYPGTKKAEMASAVASEFAKRNDWIKNPQNSPWTNVVNQLGFSWYLGFAPATAFRIHTQNSMLASPILAAKFGQLGATRELNRAVLRWATSKGKLGDTLRNDDPKDVPDVRRAFDEASDQGMFTNTWAATLGSAANGMPPDQGFGMTGAKGRAAAAVLRASQWLFNAIEHKNRQTTFVAAYRLGRMKGMSYDEAFQTANQMTWDAHLDYGNDNRARILQGNVAKVAGQFRQYPMGVAYRLARDFRNSLGKVPGAKEGGALDFRNQNLTPEEISESRKQFAGILLRSFMYSGAVGLPAMWAVAAGINLAFHDKDKPFDAQEALHSHLQKELGQTAADALMYGPVSAATGAALSSGASYSDMIPFGGWYKPPLKWNEMTPAERLSDGVQQVAGPAFGALTNMAAGAVMQRNPELALEHFMPPALQGPVKAYQYATQGATNLRGEQVMKPEEFNGWDLAVQALGITPQKLADRRAMVGTMGEISRRTEARHAELMQAMDDAVHSKDPERIKAAQADLNAFNKAQPGAATKNEARSIMSSEKARATDFHGARIPKGLKPQLMEQYGGGEK